MSKIRWTDRGLSKYRCCVGLVDGGAAFRIIVEAEGEGNATIYWRDDLGDQSKLFETLIEAEAYAGGLVRGKDCGNLRGI